MLPLGSTARSAKAGEIAAQFEVPTEVLAYLASGAFDQIDVSPHRRRRRSNAALAKATKEKKAPIYTGTDVLRGNDHRPDRRRRRAAEAGE